MKASILWSLSIMLIIVVGGALVYRLVEAPTVDYVAQHELVEPARALGDLDRHLTHQIKEHFGDGAEEDLEIDLYHPTESDLQFLMDTFRDRDPEARLSAARALIVTQDSRAVGLFLRAVGTDAERSFFCAGATEILRLKKLEDAVELMIDALENQQSPVQPECGEELRARLELILPNKSIVLPHLLLSERGRVRRYALAHLGEVEDGEIIRLIMHLAESSDSGEKALARGWLQRMGFERVVEEGAVGHTLEQRLKEGQPEDGLQRGTPNDGR